MKSKGVITKDSFLPGGYLRNITTIIPALLELGRWVSGSTAAMSRRRIMTEDRPRTPPPSRTSKRRSAAGTVGGGMGVQQPGFGTGACRWRRGPRDSDDSERKPLQLQGTGCWPPGRGDGDAKVGGPKWTTTLLYFHQPLAAAGQRVLQAALALRRSVRRRKRSAAPWLG